MFNTRRIPFSELMRALTSKLSGRRGVIAFGAFGRAFALGSQFIVLVVMSWLLPKAEFGNAMIAFTLYRLISVAIGNGFGNVLVHHISRGSADAGLETRLLRSTTLITSALVLFITLPIVLYADVIADWVGKPALAPWLFHMAPLAFFGTLNLLSASSLDARSRITTSIFVTEILPNLLRLILFGVLAVATLQTYAVAWALWLALALPWLWDAFRLLTSHPGLRIYRKADWSNAASMSVYSLAAMQLQGIDMIVVGALFSSEQSADYAVASRIASLFPFFMQLAVRSFSPRVGGLLASHDLVALQREIDSNIRWCIVSVLATSGILLAAAPTLLLIFGEFSGTIPILFLMSLAPVLRSAFVGGDRILQLGGYPHVSMAIMLAAFSIVTSLPILLSGMLGVASVPLAMLISAAILNPVIAFFAHRNFTVRSAHTVQISFLGLIIVVCCALFFSIDGRFGIYCVSAIYLLAAAAAMKLFNNSMARETKQNG